MEELFSSFISSIEPGEMKVFKNLAAIPLFSAKKGAALYITLKEAFEKNCIRVSEVSAGGIVPELTVENTGGEPVLIVDGEELIGAKQNRIVNSTILLDKFSKINIPVSCTEAGRWSYTTKDFRDSGVLLNCEIRHAKTRSVNASLNRNMDYRADQHEVWDKIDKMYSERNMKSGTHAMKDVFIAAESETDEYIKNFPVVNNQKGLLFLVNGFAAGFDMFSLESACMGIHSKLVKSYAMDAIRTSRKEPKKPDISTVKEFLSEATKSGQARFKSRGLGDDIRFESGSCVGSSLCLGEEVIHMAFFMSEEVKDPGFMSGYHDRMRRRY